jgi:flagellar basal-body rod modification protein FlgD
MATQIVGMTSAADGSAAGATPSHRATEPGAVTQEMFLQLLVTQIRHQNPLNPADGVEFLSQLAEFSGLEQMMAIRDHVEAIQQMLAAAAPPAEDQSS